MISKIDHLGIAVSDLTNALKFYEGKLGLTISEIEEVPEQKVKVAFIYLGESKIELLEATASDSPIAKFLNAKGEGIHHLALKVNNLDNFLKSIAKNEVKLIDETPRSGAGGTRVAFIHPKAAGGVLLELCERD